MTQPLATPWRRVATAVRLRIWLDRRAALVVEDEQAPVSRLDARVFEVERLARLVLVAADGATVEKRTVVMGPDDAPGFERRVLDTVEWATSLCAALLIELTHDGDPSWGGLAAGVRALAATVDEHVCRGAVPTDVCLDRRRRVG
ncbi:MAG: hypothetical protein IPL61_37900 [Myxococcales bacterium]|nr:hypothetical protein [Myxococcales bacterium]